MSIENFINAQKIWKRTGLFSRKKRYYKFYFPLIHSDSNHYEYIDADYFDQLTNEQQTNVLSRLSRQAAFRDYTDLD